MRKNKFIVIFLFFLSTVSVAQINDFRLWFDAGVEKKITRKWEVEASGSFRINENLREVGSYYGDGGVGYRVFKRFKVELHYRYSGKSDDEGFFHKRHRYYVDLSYRIKTGTPFSINLRSRLQKQYTDVFTSETGFNPANTVRGAVTVNYQYRQYEPFVGVELFYLVDNSDQYMNRIRYKIGTEYNLNKRNKIHVFYMIQQELNSPNPTRAFIGGVSYKYTL